MKSDQQKIRRNRLSEREPRFAVAWNFPAAEYLVLVAIAPIAGRASLQF
jgi:NAD-dependent DNA ligase